MAVVIPFLTHFVAQTSVWRVILGRRGWINESLTGLGIIDEPLEILFTSIAVEISMVQTLLPFMVLCIYAGMRGIPKAFMMVAQTLGAGPLRAFLRVYLPLSHAGGLGGDSVGRSTDHRVICGPRHIGEYPAARDRVISTGRGAVQFSAGDGHPGRGLDTLSGVCAMGRLQASVPSRGGIDGPKGRRAGRPSGRRFLLGGGVGLICAYLLLPPLVVVVLSFSRSSFVRFPPREFSFKWYGEYFTSADPLLHWLSATVRSVEIAVLVVVFSLAFGGIVSYALVRSRLPGRALINSFFIAPLIVPTVVTAGAIFHLYFYSTVLRHLLGTTPGMVIPHTVLALPYGDHHPDGYAQEHRPDSRAGGYEPGSESADDTAANTAAPDVSRSGPRGFFGLPGVVQRSDSGTDP